MSGIRSMATLTAREREVCVLAITGKANKEISSELGITTRTVKFHLGSIFRKYGVASRIELILNTGKPRAEEQTVREDKAA